MKKCAIALLLVACFLIGTASAEEQSAKIFPTQDGSLENTTDLAYDDIINGEGDTFVGAYTGSYGIGLAATTTPDLLNYNRIFGVTYDTSQILSNSTVTSAEMCVFGGASSETNGLGTFNYTLTSLTPNDPEALQSSDYDKIGSTHYADITYGAEWQTAQYNCFQLNPDGLNSINKSGYTAWAAALSIVVDKTDTGYTWDSGEQSRYPHYQSGYSGTVRDPYLNVIWDTYTGGGDPPVASFTCDHTFLRIPQPVTCTDTSTETPTSWNWSFGDGTYSTDENPVHKYTCLLYTSPSPRD